MTGTSPPPPAKAAWCRAAAQAGADVAVLPELWQLGYAPCPTDPEGHAAWCAQATGAGGSFVCGFRALAAELGMAIVVTHLQPGVAAPSRRGHADRPPR